MRQSCNRKRYGIVYFKLQLLGLYSVPSLDRHFSQSHTVLSRRGARGLVCRTDTPEYLLSDYYGHRCGGSRWLDQERRIFLFMSRVSLCWRTSYVQETRAIPYKSSTQGGSKNHEQHPCLLSSQNVVGLDYSYPGPVFSNRFQS